MGKPIEIEVNGVREWVDDSTLDYKETLFENDDRIEKAQEWRRGDLLVKRNAHVTLKKWPEGMHPAMTQLGKIQ